MTDVVIAGGGVIGLSVAWELAQAGLTVAVFDQGPVGREASWAGAGMLPPGQPAHAATPEARLRALSHTLWPDWTERLRSATGIDNGFRNCGALDVSIGEPLDDEISGWKAEGLTVERLSGEEARAVEPALSPSITQACRRPEFSQVRNPRHLKALRLACEQAHVRFYSGTPVVGWQQSGDRVTAALTSAGPVTAGQFVVACGAWSQPLLSPFEIEAGVQPVRGQIVLLNVPGRPFTHVLQVGPRYLVPRSDGRILVGSTEEHAGFVKQNTVEGIQGLLQFATSLVPELRNGEVERCWSGLRPGSRLDAPLVGRAGQCLNVFAATGHFRSGLQMSPGTAALIRQLVTGRPTEIPPTIGPNCST